MVSTKEWHGFSVKLSLEDLGAKGKGLVAAESIAKGRIVWNGAEGSERIYEDQAEFLERLASLSSEESARVLSHVYVYDGKLREVLSNGRYTNHAKNATTGFLDALVAQGDCPIAPDGTPLPEEDWLSECTFALVDIAIGDEITENYATNYCDTLDWYEELCTKHCVESVTVCAEKYS